MPAGILAVAPFGAQKRKARHASVAGWNELSLAVSLADLVRRLAEALRGEWKTRDMQGIPAVPGEGLEPPTRGL